MGKGKYLITNLDGTPIDCPAFVLLAKDVFAPVALNAYYKTIVKLHPDDEYTRKTYSVSWEFHSWRTKHPDEVKIPD